MRKNPSNLSWTKKSHQILEVATDLHRYNHWIYTVFKPHFQKNILEIGSGLGGITDYLPTKNLTLSDLREDYVAKLKKHYPKIKVIKLDIQNLKNDDQKPKYDTIFSSNVFEHIRDDEKSLANCYKLLNNHGKLLLFVPACPGIYGELDINMGHYRRYTLNELSKKVQKAGFRLIDIRYVNLIGYFLWWGRGKLLSKIVINKSNQSNTDSALAQIFDILITPILKIEKYFRLPFGQSLILIAQKD